MLDTKAKYQHLAEDVAFMLSHGEDRERIAKRLGYSEWKSLEKMLRTGVLKYGVPDPRPGAAAGSAA